MKANDTLTSVKSDMSDDVDLAIRNDDYYEKPKIKDLDGTTSTKKCCYAKTLIDISVFMLGFLTVVLSISFVILVSDSVIRFTSGRSIIVPEKSNDDENIWTVKNAAFIVVVTTPFFMIVYYASMSVVRLEIVKLCVDVMNIRSKKCETSNYDLSMKMELDYTHRIYSAPKARDDVFIELDDVTKDKQPVDPDEELYSSCCFNLKKRDKIVSANGVVEDVDRVDKHRIELRYGVITNLKRISLFILVYIISVLSAWIIIKLFSFQIFGTMTISDINVSLKVSKYEWIGLSDLYVVLYHLFIIPIFYIMSKKLTSDVIADTLTHMCSDPINILHNSV